MPASLPKTTLKFLSAVMKHQAKIWLGEGAVDIAVNTIVDEDLQKRVDDWLADGETEKQLLAAAQKADKYFRQHCEDDELKQAHSLGFTTLPTVQAELANLPEELDVLAVEKTLREALTRDLPNLSAAQHENGARLYADALIRAVGQIEKFFKPVVIQFLSGINQKQDEANQKLDVLIARVQRQQLAEGSYLPFPPNELFTGREKELQTLADALLKDDANVVINQQALIGMGGVGKTQLAVQFAWTYLDRFVGAHWVSAFRPKESSLSTEQHVNLSIAQCGEKMNLQFPTQDPDQRAEQTLAAWKASGPRLVILDNLEDPQAAPAILARLRHAHIRVLLTTRQSGWNPALGLRELSLPSFTEEESLAFLRRTLNVERASDADLKALHHKLGGLPLTLDLAASYLGHVNIAAREYLSRLGLDHASLKNWRAKYPNATQHDKDAAATFALSWDLVESETARRLFLLAGYDLPNEPLRADVLQRALQLEAEAFSAELDLLQTLSLIQANGSLHPLLAEFSRLQDADGSALFQWARAMAWRSYAWYEHGGIHRDPDLARRAHLSLPDLLRAAEQKEKEPKELSNFYFNLAFLLTHFGNLDGAMQLYQQALEMLEGLGDLQGKSATLHQMAGIYVTRGDLDGAMKLYQQSLEIFEGLGDLKGKIVTLANMAHLLQESDAPRAISIYNEALNTAQNLQSPFDIGNIIMMMSDALIQTKENQKALEYLIEAFNLFVQLQAKRQINSVAGRLQNMRKTIGENEFDVLWEQKTHSPLPEWLQG